MPTCCTRLACAERRALACAVELDNEVSVAGCYLLSGVIGEELDGLIDDLVQKLGLANGDDVFMNVTPIMLTAVWMGLTLAHVRMGDSVYMPYRLFPELSAASDASAPGVPQPLWLPPLCGRRSRAARFRGEPRGRDPGPPLAPRSRQWPEGP